MDFTITQYTQLLKSLQDAGFFFQTFEEYITQETISITESQSRHHSITPPLNHAPTHPRKIILRHDVDLLPHHSLRFAQIQHSMGIKGSYYFRAVPESWDEDVIKEIAALGHEVGYHYENMDAVHFPQSANLSPQFSQRSLRLSKRQSPPKEYSAPEKHIDFAYENFLENLEKLRQLTEVKTICMHGSPRSKYDNKAIWEKYDYKKLGIIGEPYYDMNFDNVFYLTDTGRRWDGWKTSVRDKVPQQEEWVKQGLVFHSTKDIIQAIENGRSSRCDALSLSKCAEVLEASGVEMPDQIMMTFHPQRWNDKTFPWLKELLIQNLKNQIKKLLIKQNS